MGKPFWLACVVLICFSPWGIWADIEAEKPDVALLRHADDYVFGYYPHGWRRQEKTPIEFAVQTNKYGMVFNATSGAITRLGPIADAANAETAVVQDNAILATLPEFVVSFSVLCNGREFPVSSGAGASDQVRLYQCGKYLQHFDIQTAAIGGAATGPGLTGATAWLDVYCWSDRLTAQLHVARYDDARPAQHLSNAWKLDNVVLAATIKVPPKFGATQAFLDDAWQTIDRGQNSDTIIAVCDDSGAGLAVIAVPGCEQKLSVKEDRKIRVESAPSPLAQTGSMTFPCLIVPSTNVKETAARELRQMKMGLEKTAQVTAEGIAPYSGDLEVHYDAAKGWHEVMLGENADANVTERVRLKLLQPGTEHGTVRLNFLKTGSFPVTGMSPVLRDMSGAPLGLPVQISKNWHCAPAWFTGIAVVDVVPGRENELEFDLAYARWGKLPAVSHAQLCLFGYGGNQIWDEMAIGSWGETICYDPDVNLNRSMVDDMRPLMVWAMGKEPHRQWSWTNNVGGCDFLTLFLKGDAKRQYMTRQKTLYSSYGPVMTDVTYAGQTPDGAIQSRVRTQTWRADDYARALYSLRYDVVKPVADIDRIAFFQLGADHYNDLEWRQIVRGSAEGFTDAWEPAPGGLSYSRRGEPLTGRLPWIGLYGLASASPGAVKANDQGALANKAMIVRQWKARMTGKEVLIPAYSVFGTENGPKSVLIELSPPADVTAFDAGDFIEAQIEVLILPQTAEDYYGPNQPLIRFMQEHRECWALTAREAFEPDVRVSVGTPEQIFPARVKAESGRAEFMITGSVGCFPITITGLKENKHFTLSRVKDDAGGAGPGSLETIDQSSGIGNDWWQTRYDTGSGSWDVTFTSEFDSPGCERKFKWSQP